ncbi:MAG: TetR/AcrR family transcriptional regulator [Rhodocyclaceae bacterium]|nr:TetR/AcrR family transcriptional regulator [Rhodocyclaceae bacterium]
MSKVQENLSSRELILETAVRLFGEKGYTGTTMRDIAKAVGLLPGSLYAHIDSKEALLLEIVGLGINRFLSILELVESSTESADQRLRVAINAHLMAVAEDPARTLVIFHQWRFLTDTNRERAIDMRRQYAQAFKQIIEDGIQSGVFRSDLNVRVAVFSVLGALNWASEWYSAKGPMNADELGEAFSDTLLYGLCASQPVKKKTTVKRTK